MTKNPWVLAWVLMVVGLGACGGEEPPASEGRVATWSVSGSRSTSQSHDDELNYVRCTLTPSGLLDMSAAELAGVDPGITVRINDYFEPGSYDFQYRTGGPAGSAEVRLVGGYNYWLFYDTSTIDFTDVVSSCSVVISEPVPGERIHAEISCADLVAQITSPDYDDRDGRGLRSHVELMATFDCDI